MGRNLCWGYSRLEIVPNMPTLLGQVLAARVPRWHFQDPISQEANSVQVVNLPDNHWLMESLVYLLGHND